MEEVYQAEHTKDPREAVPRLFPIEQIRGQLKSLTSVCDSQGYQKKLRERNLKSTHLDVVIWCFATNVRSLFTGPRGARQCGSEKIFACLVTPALWLQTNYGFVEIWSERMPAPVRGHGAQKLVELAFRKLATNADCSFKATAHAIRSWIQ